MGNSKIQETLQQLIDRLPPGWRLIQGDEVSPEGVDVLATVAAPDGSSIKLLIEYKDRVEPRSVPLLFSRAQGTLPGIRVLAVPFLTSGVRERLTEAGIGYVDLTGNVRLVAERPGLFIATAGLDKNPFPERRGAASFKGAKAGRLVRALCDFVPPLGVRDLANRTCVDPGYVSRLLRLADAEALLTRAPRGPVLTVDWRRLLRRWVEDYTPFDRRRLRAFLAPRGLAAIEERLGRSSLRYAITGAVAAAKLTPVAIPRHLTCYVDDPDTASEVLGLRQAEIGANVLLVSPFDPVVYERGQEWQGLRLAAVSQICADLLTSPGRGPAEAEAFMSWMADHEHEWRV
ncbi:MAG: hypothetical protein C3F12_10270 [Candidatus Methylomirabilota bacterium]|nr:type IV toxin-antitoxin system AbiEi family antitoxin [Candidatus Methylomirabilis sp.]PWB45358.1 MAG: hypothetical protein C3F12_10270 [candidate division NC10 bacterium]